ncbi:TPA: hypothetical protein ACS7WR_003669 [Providencia alcalifaciens]
MNKSTLNKVEIALSLLFLSNIAYSSEENNKVDEVILYFTLSQCSEYVIGTKHPDRTLDENIVTYSDYLRIDKKDISLISQKIIKLKGALPQLGLMLLKDNANRNKKVSFCAIASVHCI